MKKLLCVLLVLSFVFALAACGGEETPATATESKTVGVEEETAPVTTPVTTEGKTEIPEEPEDTETAIGSTDTKPAPDVEDVTNTTEDDNTALYTVKVVDEAGNPVTTATLVQICDEVCVPVKLVNGVGEKKLEINENYHVQLTSGLPEGYEFTTEETEYYFDENNVCTIVLKAVA